MSTNNEFKSNLKLKSIDEINEFIIQLSKNPKIESLKIIDYFIDELSNEYLNKIKINLIYLLGKIASNVKIKDKYINFLLEQHAISDRWVRNEIIIALKFISQNQNLNDNIKTLLLNSLNESYLPIVSNVLDIFLNFDNIEQALMKNILQLLNIGDHTISILCKKILKKNIKNEIQLFEILNEENYYKIINNRMFRQIIVSFFNSILDLESFKSIIENSSWEVNIKESFLKEINTFQKILLKVF